MPIEANTIHPVGNFRSGEVAGFMNLNYASVLITSAMCFSYDEGLEEAVVWNCRSTRG